MRLERNPWRPDLRNSVQPRQSALLPPSRTARSPRSLDIWRGNPVLVNVSSQWRDLHPDVAIGNAPPRTRPSKCAGWCSVDSSTMRPSEASTKLTALDLDPEIAQLRSRAASGYRSRSGLIGAHLAHPGNFVVASHRTLVAAPIPSTMRQPSLHAGGSSGLSRQSVGAGGNVGTHP